MRFGDRSAKAPGRRIRGWARVQREIAIARARGVGWRNGVDLGRRSIIIGFSPVIERAGGEITFGERAVIYGREARAMFSCSEGGRLRVGVNALVNSGASIHASGSISIGANLLMAAFASISDTDAHEVVVGSGVRVSAVRIGDNVWIGRGAIVLPGVSVGDGAVVGATAVVTKDVPPYSLAVGNPARVIKSLTPVRDGVRRR